MLSCGQIVLDFITETPCVVLKIKTLQRKVTVLSLESLTPFDRDISDLKPWDPPPGGGCGGIIPPSKQLSEDEVDGLLSILERHSSLSNPSEVEYRTNNEQIALIKITKLHEALMLQRVLAFV